MHSTNKAFERYFQIEMDEVREVYREAGNEKNRKYKQGENSYGL